MRHRIAECTTGIIRAMTVEIAESFPEGAEDIPLPSIESYWPEMASCLWGLAQSNQPNLLQNALFILTDCPGVFGTNIDAHLPNLRAFTLLALQHESIDIRTAGADTFSSLLTVVEPKGYSFFSDLVGPTVQVRIKY